VTYHAPTLPSWQTSSTCALETGKPQHPGRPATPSWHTRREGRGNPANWRLISLQCTIYKLYSTILAKWLTAWAVDGKKISSFILPLLLQSSSSPLHNWLKSICLQCPLVTTENVFNLGCPGQTFGNFQFLPYNSTIAYHRVVLHDHSHPSLGTRELVDEDNAQTVTLHRRMAYIGDDSEYPFTNAQRQALVDTVHQLMEQGRTVLQQHSERSMKYQ
jgi:hypothetical protein